jgi:hypothetical protein
MPFFLCVLKLWQNGERGTQGRKMGDIPSAESRDGVRRAPAPTDRDERADRERGLLEAHLARRERDD